MPHKRFYLLLWLSGILVLTFLLYYKVLFFGWITGSDQRLITDNPLMSSLSLSNIPDMFLSFTEGRYQAVTFLSYSLDLYVFAAAPIKGIHLLNLIFHLLNIMLFFSLLRLLTDKLAVVIIAVLLFAIHPLNVEAVAWMSARAYLLSTFFLLLAALAYLHSLKPSVKRKRYFRFAAGLYFFALLSNPIAVVFPLVVMLFDFIHQRSIREGLKEKLYLLIPGLLIMVIGIQAQMSMMESATTILPGFPDKLIFAPYSIATIIYNFYVPASLSAYHPTTSNLLVILSSVFIVTIVITFTAVRAYKRNALLFSSLIFFLITISLSFISSFASPGMYNESDAYLPGLGLSVLTGILLHALYVKVFSRSKISVILIILLFGAYISILSKISYERLFVWENSETLWTDVISSYPDDGHAFFMRGDYWAMNASYDKAKFDYQQSIRRDPHAFEAMNNLGLIYLEEGDLRVALSEFSGSVEVNKHFYKAHLNRGLTYMRLGKNDQALENMNRAIELNSNVALAYYNRGLVYERLNLLKDAVEDFTRAIRIEPSRLIFYIDRAKAYTWLSNYHFAELDYTRALNMDAANAELWFRRSLVRTQQNKFREGLEDAMMAQSLGFHVEEEYIKGLSFQLLKDELPEDH
ncbi:MAG: tetratricopeptide repeat protein [Bacteroidota bacterium]